jgi:hypothetical protein
MTQADVTRRPSGRCVASVELNRDGVVAALRARRGTLAAKLLFFLLLLLVRVLELLQLRRQPRGLHARRGSLRPRAPPGADGAAKRLVHGRIDTAA